MTDCPRIRLGTRASALARWQADWTATQLAALGVEVEMILITTEGDVRQGPLGQIGGQGLFTKRIQQALLDEEIDLAVHSLKDLPTEPVDQLSLAAVPPREENSDAFVSNQAESLAGLPARSCVGTGSKRRQAQLLHHRPDLRVADIRGNVDTRLSKLDEGQFDAIILANAGLTRLGLTDRITQVIPWEIMLPAVGQGALGLETRCSDESTRQWVAQLDHPATHASVVAERAMLADLRGGCLAPVGAWGRVEHDMLVLDAVVLSEDGQQRITATAQGAVDAAAKLGEAVAADLIAQGARELIQQARDPSR